MQFPSTISEGKVKLRELSVDVADFLPISEEQLAPRSLGLHVSQIINYISTTIGRRDNDFTREDLDAFAVVGRMFERILAETIFRPPRYIRPGEITMDGITGSPDAVDCDDGAVVEIKASFKSSKHDIQTFREYWWQQMAYCHMLDVNVSKLYVFYVNGDYSPPKPTWPPRAWEAEFGKHELRDNWAMLVRNGKDIQS